MTDNFIQLNKSNLIRLGIKDYEGNDTGNYLEFDLEDIELPLRLQELIETDKRNAQNLKNQLAIIDKRQDVKGKKMLSKNEEDKIKVVNEYMKKEVEVFNMFLGENGVEKLLNGRKLGLSTLEEVADIITKQIAPFIDANIVDITEKVKKKYSNITSSEDKVLKNE